MATAGQTVPAGKGVAASLNSHYAVTVYARDANGNVAPARTIGDITTSENATEVGWYSGIALDTVHGEIFVVDNWGPAYSIDVYPRDANGNVAPIRRISVNATGLVRPSGVAVDPASNEIFVTNEDVDGASSINVYPENANGNIAPVRVITGDATALTGPFAISLMAEKGDGLLFPR